MIRVEQVSKSFASQVLFEDVTFNIGSGERIGLIGRNGHGKSTLFKIFKHEIEVDTGRVRIPQSYRLGFLEQKLEFKKNSVLEEACRDLPHSIDGTDLSYQAKAILLGMGFKEEQFDLAPQKLSGGFQVRLNLVRLLASKPDMLLLDEPTNYLDIVSLRWLETFLKQWSGELLLITHDRQFMDAVVTHILGIHRQHIKKIKGKTADYYQQRDLEEQHYELTRQNQLKKREATEAFVQKFRAKASKAKQVQSRIKALEKQEVQEELEAMQNLSLQFPYTEFRGKWLMHVKDLAYRYHPEHLWLFEHLNFSIKTGDRIAIIGKNGKGKTTLLRLLADDLDLESGNIEKAANVKLAYFGQTNVERLDPNVSIEEEVLRVQPSASRTQVRSVCASMLFTQDQALKKISVLSGGEKARVLLAKLLMQEANFLLLDEPTNHLDIESSEELLRALKKYPGTLVMVTHNEEFLYSLANRLIVFDRNQVQEFNGSYSEFLQQVGWEDENSEIPQEALVEEKRLSKKELRQKRAAELKQRNDVLKPIEKRMSQIENEITQLEQQCSHHQEELLKSAKENQVEKNIQHSKELKSLEEKIEVLFEELALLEDEKQKNEPA